MRVERAWYESSPYLYAGVAVLTVLHASDSVLMRISSFVLLAAALNIIGRRWIYRRDVVRNGGPPIDPRQSASSVPQDVFCNSDLGDPRQRRDGRR